MGATRRNFFDMTRRLPGNLGKTPGLTETLVALTNDPNRFSLEFACFITNLIHCLTGCHTMDNTR